MREALALMLASWLTASSYRLRMVLSVVSMLVAVVPVYFIAGALQPVMAGSIARQGGDYFGFLLLGMIAFLFVTTAVSALPAAVSVNVSNGTLEALFCTRARVPTLFAGMMAYGLAWTGIRALLLLGAGWVFGMQVEWSRIPIALLILVLIVMAYLPFGLFAAAAVVAFRTTGPLVRGVIVVSALLGGVYYPTHVIPAWIEGLAAAVPLTYGLRALRQALLEQVPLGSLAPDIAALGGFVIVLSAAGVVTLGMALRRARHAGTLAQY